MLGSVFGGQVTRYNVAPSQPIPVITNLATRQVKFLKWGLLPGWVKDPKTTNHLINARAESLSEKPFFRQAYQKRRCLILVDGFYDWQKIPKGTSQPYYFRSKDIKPFAFAGLRETWQSKETHEDVRKIVERLATTNTVLLIDKD